MVMCFIAISCAQGGRDPMAPSPMSRTVGPPPFSVRVVEDTLTWQARPGYRTFVATVRFRNSGAQPLYRHWCAATIERFIEGAWVEVQQVICLEGFPEYVSIAPGDSGTQVVRGYRYPDPRHPYGDPRLVAGTYRLVFLLGYDYRSRSGLEVLASEADRATQPFVVRDP